MTAAPPRAGGGARRVDLRLVRARLGLRAPAAGAAPVRATPVRPAASRPGVRGGPAAPSVARLRALMAASTATLLAGLALAALLGLGAGDVDATFRWPAPVIGAALALALAIEAGGGLRNLVRVDLFMLVVLYLLTFLEFLFPQASVADRVTLGGAQAAVTATTLGFAGIVVGRHAVPPVRAAGSFAHFAVSPRQTIGLLGGCMLLGHLYMLLAVDFDVVEMIGQMSRPRFSQPWSRGRLGGVATLLNEVALLTYLVPPLVAAVLAQARRYTPLQILLAAACLLFVLYEGFAGGTRNVFLTHVATFAAAFTLLQPKLTPLTLVRIAAPALVVAAGAVYYMAEIRTVGLSNFALAAARTDALFVDMNLLNIAGLTEVFPRLADHLGFEIPVTAAIRPIPRALWPGKPEGLSVSIEAALGVGPTMTLSATFVGELWMAGGFGAVGLGALLFGAAAAAWNRVGARAASNLQLILFAAGFFPAGICMRSVMAVGPPLLPLIALMLVLRLLREAAPRPRAMRRARPVPVPLRRGPP